MIRLVLKFGFILSVLFVFNACMDSKPMKLRYDEEIRRLSITAKEDISIIKIVATTRIDTNYSEEEVKVPDSLHLKKNEEKAFAVDQYGESKLVEVVIYTNKDKFVYELKDIEFTEM